MGEEGDLTRRARKGSADRRRAGQGLRGVGGGTRTTAGGGRGRWHRGLAAKERHCTLEVILHGRHREGGGDFAATLDLLLRHNPDQVLAVVEREAACTARRATLVAAHLGTARCVLAWRLARRALL